MSYAYGYVRASTYMQFDSPEVQKERIRKHLDYRFSAGMLSRGQEPPEWVGFFEDRATTSGIPLIHRDYGKQLLARLEPGDHVLVTALDRIFRNFSEAGVHIESWGRRDITLHVIKMGADTSTIFGRMNIQMVSVYAEFERAMLIERISDTVAWRRHHGMAIGHPCRWQKIVVKREHGRKVKYVTDDPQKIQILEDICNLHEGGYSTTDVLEMLRAKCPKIDWNWQKVYDAWKSWTAEKMRREEQAAKQATETNGCHNVSAR